ncbi:MAG: putative N-acetylmuramoyl-L-alanine amidase [Pseudomonadota bacterium]|jgi:N-acetylmuramoyl-L-alanine amidase
MDRRLLDRRAFIRFAAGVPTAAVFGTAFGLVLAGSGPAAAQSPRVPGRKPGPPRLIMLDPGHGGRDPGAIGRRGTLEKDVVLDIAKQAAVSLRRGSGATVVLTRDTDVFLELKDRVALARDAKADLFISIHADSAPDAKARGLSAYTLSEKASDSFAAAIAQQENLADALGVDTSGLSADVQAFLVDLAADHTKRASVQAKQALVSGAGRDLRLLDNPMRSANFAVLRAPDIPSVLVETGFLSNREDENLLREAASRRRIADVLARELTTVMRQAPFAA